MGQVGQYDPARPHFLRDLNGPGDVVVKGMGRPAQAVYHHGMHPLQQQQRVGRNTAAVRQIGKWPYPVATGSATAMFKGYRRNAQPEQLKGAVNHHRLHQRWMRRPFITDKNIAKTRLQPIYGRLAAITGDHRTMEKVEAAQVVNTIDMIGVGMGKQHAIDLLYAMPQHLQPQIRRGIHQNRIPLMRDQERSPAPLITGIGRTADRALAANHRHTGGGAASKYRYLHGNGTIAKLFQPGKAVFRLQIQKKYRSVFPTNKKRGAQGSPSRTSDSSGC